MSTKIFLRGTSSKNFVPSQFLCVKTTEESTLKYAMYHSCACLEKKLLEDALSDRRNKILNVSICEGNCIKRLVTNTEPFGIERYPNLKCSYESGYQFKNILKVQDMQSLEGRKEGERGLEEERAQTK